MINFLILTVLLVAIVLAVVVVYRNRTPTAEERVRNIDIDVKRGVRDALNATKDAAEDAHNAVKDAAK